MLVLDHFTVRRAGRRLFAPLIAQVRPSDAVAVLGPNGSGKTSLFAGLLDVLSTSEGTATFWNQPLRLTDRRKIGVVWQEGGLPLGVSTKRWAHHLARIHYTNLNRGVLEQLALMPSSTTLRELSGGERQRWALYSALAHSPLLLLLDEPTNSLDDSARSALYSLLTEHRNRGGAILFSTHQAADVSFIGATTIHIGNFHDRAIATFTTTLPLEIADNSDIAQHENGYFLLKQVDDPINFVNEFCIAQGSRLVSFVQL